MKDIDAKVYAEQLKSFYATVAMINVGGILASYPSEVEDHTVSDYLTGDPLEKIIDQCHANNIKVIARMDFSKARRPVYEKHPDWAYRTVQGQIIDYNGDVHMCPCGGFQQEKAFEIMKEVVERFPVDGVFINMGGFQQRDYSYHYYGICHCDNCKRFFRERFHLELPEKEDINDPIYRIYRRFQKEVIQGIQKRMSALIKSINPGIALDGEDFSRVESNTEYQRSGPQWMYSSSSIARCESSLQRNRVCSNAAVDFIGFYYRHVAVSPWMQSLRMWQDVANYGGLDYYIIGRLDNHRDKSGYEMVKKVFRYMEDHEAQYCGMCVQGDALLVHPGKYGITAEAAGWVRALTESHIFFEETDPEMITCQADLAKFQTVIFADIQTISKDLCAIVDTYVADGGCLIITGETGKYDAEGNECATMTFQSIGAKGTPYYRKNMCSAMFQIGPEEKMYFPSLPETNLLFFGDEYIYGQYEDTVERYLGLIPPHPYGPPERCYYNFVTRLPGFTVNHYGQGRAIRIPWFPGKLYHLEGYDNTFLFMKDLLISVIGLESAEDEPFTPMVEVTRGYDHHKTHAMVHLVNGTGHFGRSFFQPIPVQQIQLKVALDQKPNNLTSLTTGRYFDFKWENGHVFFTVPELKEFEAIDICF